VVEYHSDKEAREGAEVVVEKRRFVIRVFEGKKFRGEILNAENNPIRGQVQMGEGKKKGKARKRKDKGLVARGGQKGKGMRRGNEMGGRLC